MNHGDGEQRKRCRRQSCGPIRRLTIQAEDRRRFPHMASPKRRPGAIINISVRLLVVDHLITISEVHGQ